MRCVSTFLFGCVLIVLIGCDSSAPPKSSASSNGEAAKSNAAQSSKGKNIVYIMDEMNDADLEREIEANPNTVVLEISASNVTDDGLKSLGKLKKLNKLSLSGPAKITDNGLVHLKGVGQLRTLSIVDLPAIDGTGFKHLREVPHLKFLTVARCPLGNNLEGLSVLRLNFLHLNYCEVTDAGLKHLSGMTDLHTLSLVDAKITDAGLTHLKGLKNLGGALSFGKNELLTREAVDELNAALPNATPGFRK